MEEISLGTGNNCIYFTINDRGVMQTGEPDLDRLLRDYREAVGKIIPPRAKGSYPTLDHLLMETAVEATRKASYFQTELGILKRENEFLKKQILELRREELSGGLAISEFSAQSGNLSIADGAGGLSLSAMPSQPMKLRTYTKPGFAYRLRRWLRGR